MTWYTLRKGSSELKTSDAQTAEKLQQEGYTLVSQLALGNTTKCKE